MKMNADTNSIMEEYQFCLECPRLFLANFFIELKGKVDYEVEKVLNNEINSDNAVNIEKINKKRTEFINRINQFETECLKRCNQNVMKFKESLENQNAHYQKEISTKEKLTALKRLLFMDKNMIFIKSIRINNGYYSDPSAFGKLIVVNKYYH